MSVWICAWTPAIKASLCFFSVPLDKFRMGVASILLESDATSLGNYFPTFLSNVVIFRFRNAQEELPVTSRLGSALVRILYSSSSLAPFDCLYSEMLTEWLNMEYRETSIRRNSRINRNGHICLAWQAQN
jgi:hypothetical protein